MITIKDIFEGAERFINEILRKEIQNQGHTLTGHLEESLDSQISKKGKEDSMKGFAAFYIKFLEEGFPAKSANFGQVPFLREYFIKRGLSTEEATAAAFATVKTWMKEGMPTEASKRFSNTGTRTHLVENSLIGNKPKIDDHMKSSIDFAMKEKFKQAKGGVI